MQKIGTKIKKIRLNKGLSQQELAQLAKVNLRTIQRIEKNKNQPHGKTLNLICEALETNIEEILEYGKKLDTNYLIFFHLSVLSFLFIPVGNILLPLILWMNKKNSVIGLNKMGANLLNFQILWTIITTACIITYSFLKIMHYNYQNIFLVLCIGLIVLNILLPVYLALNVKKDFIDKKYPKFISFI